MSGKIKALGVCLGASSISAVAIERPSQAPSATPSASSAAHIGQVVTRTHDGNPKKTLLDVLGVFDLSEFDRVAATGRAFRRLVRFSSISEPEAVEYAYAFCKPPDISCPAVISAGGETFMVYVLNRDGQITNVLTGNKCASGTGEFFLQQLRRLNVTLEEAAQWAAIAEPHHVSGRCSVFCKSDCTHATNKGIPKSRVTAGLCRMMASKILELLKKIERRHIMLVGGAARNTMMAGYLREEIEHLMIPEQAPYFEALGAALWALDHPTEAVVDVSELFKQEEAAFDSLPPLKQFFDQVAFKDLPRGQVAAGDTCILGLDVGSTTTKAVLLRTRDNALLASVYLRTNGDPVGASRQCYRAIAEQVQAVMPLSDLEIIGLGVCGSGRQIAGLHAFTDGVINEIIAHAAAAVYFDPAVDTLFEIGGQDAKYTYITAGVPSDYAMNEACSAGTGSFLEESAYETLGVPMEDIGELALQGTRPPNFNDQCAAFIASDIKNAINEGIAHADIVAGLVYSICMNYANRVKGNRPVGEKVFMQGGVCYNRAIPLAMAGLVGKPIVVPPEPGLMGAFGVALEVKQRLTDGLLPAGRFDLQALADREVAFGKSFVCKGGKEGCDRHCEIAMVLLDGQKFPFGGACNRYYNIRHQIQHDAQKLDLVRARQKLVFEAYGFDILRSGAFTFNGRIGFNKSFLTNTYFPLYSRFFAELGYEAVIASRPSQAGIDQRNAAFCFPAELAHGFFEALLATEPRLDAIFLPHFKSVPTNEPDQASQVCPFVQGETYYLRSTFQRELSILQQQGTRLLTPLLDLNQGLQEAAPPLVACARQMGLRKGQARKAFASALAQYQECLQQMQVLGQRVLNELERDPDRMAVVIVSRPYSGYVDEAHMGIPHKLASRGITVLPLDFLPLEHEFSKEHMYWGIGQLILKAARFIAGHPQLFGIYITNFSCGPDSFLITFFRDIMGRKPSLTLELDSHTADAGLETRIEAFLDIVAAYRQLMARRGLTTPPPFFRPAAIQIADGKAQVLTSKGEALALTDPRVTVLIPSMGRLSSESLMAIFKGLGINAVTHPESDEQVLKIGRANTSCKECLPLILTSGSLLNYIHNHQQPDEILVYFMPTGSGPCRFGQYYIFMQDLVKRLQLPDVAMLALSSENSYAGLDASINRKSWWGVLVSDVMEDIRSMLLANAVQVTEALQVFESTWQTILQALESGDLDILTRCLENVAATLKQIPLRRPCAEVPLISLTGEIFVRRDALSRQQLTERLAQKGFAVTCAPIAEWVLYSEYLYGNNLTHERMTLLDRINYHLRKRYMARIERKFKAILAGSGLVAAHPIPMDRIIHTASPFVSPNLAGEAILTVGGALVDVVSHTCGVIAIGPFGCMPNRLSESILSEVMTVEHKLAACPDEPHLRRVLAGMEDLPFLAIESDGSPFPQIINAKLETFCLRAERLHERMRGAAV